MDSKINITLTFLDSDKHPPTKGDRALVAEISGAALVFLDVGYYVGENVWEDQEWLNRVAFGRVFYSPLPVGLSIPLEKEKA